MNLKKQIFRTENTQSLFILFAFMTAAFLIRVGYIMIYADEHKFNNYEYGSHDTHRPIYDDHRYIEIAMNLVEGNGFPVIYETPPYSYDFRRGPIYFLFLSLIFYFYGFNIIAVCVFQALLSSLSILFIYKIALHYYDCKVALFSALVWIIYPASILWTTSIYRETLTVFLVLITTWRMIVYVYKSNVYNGISVGLFCGLTFLQDPFTQVLLPIYLIYFWMVYGKEPGDKLIETSGIFLQIGKLAKNFFSQARKKIIFTSIILIPLGITIGPWLSYTHSKTGRAVLATAGEFGFWDNIALYYELKLSNDTNNRPDLSGKELGEFITNFHYSLASRYLQMSDSHSKKLTIIQKERVLEFLKNNPYFIRAAEYMNFRRAVTILLDHPEYYFGNPFGKQTVIKLSNYWINLTGSHEKNSTPNISTLYQIINTKSVFIKIIGIIAILLSLGMFYVFIRYAHRAWLLFWFWAAYFLFFNILSMRGEARYVLPVLAFNVIIITGGIFAIVDIVRKTHSLKKLN